MKASSVKFGKQYFDQNCRSILNFGTNSTVGRKGRRWGIVHVLDKQDK